MALAPPLTQPLTQPQPPLTQEQTDLREKFLAHIHDDEHSDLPIKQYRVVFPGSPGYVEHLTIESRTELGALIAFADWKSYNTTCGNTWEYYKDKYYYNIDDDDYIKDLIEELISELIKTRNQLDPNTEYEYLIEVTPIIIRPFNQTLVKGTR